MRRGATVQLNEEWWLVCAPENGKLYYARDQGAGAERVEGFLVPPRIRDLGRKLEEDHEGVGVR